MIKKTSIFKDKNILITGGTGSFGMAFAKHLLMEDQCNKVIIFSRDEWKQWEMKQIDPIFNHPKMRYFLGDVRDANRLARAFFEVHYIIHAAALKQVPAAEYNPSEFIKTNILGAMNIIDQAIDNGVEKVIALSTDKAANPINLYGATKLCSDKLFVAAHSYVGARGKPTFSVVRYGNVVGSRGSIIPFWKKLIEGKTPSLPVTDSRMTRFWITIDQAVHFVRKCMEESQGGEIYVPKIPSFNITDLAKAMAPNIPISYTGIREGEKLHELMVTAEDSRHTHEFKDYFIIIPEAFTHNPILLKRMLNGRKGKPLAEGFAYASNTNKDWLSVSDLRKQLSFERL